MVCALFYTHWRRMEIFCRISDDLPSSFLKRSAVLHYGLSRSKQFKILHLRTQTLRCCSLIFDLFTPLIIVTFCYLHMSGRLSGLNRCLWNKSSRLLNAGLKSNVWLWSWKAVFYFQSSSAWVFFFCFLWNRKKQQQNKQTMGLCLTKRS